jgi:cytochrome c peroxidase
MNIDAKLKNTAGFALISAVAGALVVVAAPAGRAPSYDRNAARADYQRPAAIPYPKDNQITPARELLGRTLFFDPRLSGSHFISCATCHNPGFSWSDGLPKAIGHGMNQLGRRTPTILNCAWGDSFFWDGRADSLEEQALGPIKSPGEMNQPLDKMIKGVSDIKGYAPLFEAAFPGDKISEKTVAKAIASFERTIVSGTAPFDKWVAGDNSAISEQAMRGFDLFNTKAGCAKCHSGWAFTDNGFHDIGVASADRGRGALLPLEAMQYAFKTPTLRNVAVRTPYMHDGSETTLEDVIEFYNQGGRAARPSLAPEIFKLNLTQAEKDDLIAFLETLTSNDKQITVPVLPR